MKTLRRVVVGLGIAALCLSGCAERPGQKKDDKDKKADKKTDDDKVDEKSEQKD